MAFSNLNKQKIGVLGGGQLGKMLATAASPWHLQLAILDPTPSCPAWFLGRPFVQGDFKNFEDVYGFGQIVDILTIEIEHVNTEALKVLQSEGVIVYPDPNALDIIKDKGLQNQFYLDKGLPSSAFKLYDDERSLFQAIQSGRQATPLVQKTRTAGYDGRGVAIIKENPTQEDLLVGPSVAETLVDIQKELAVVVARNANGDIKSFPVVEMVFDPVANLVDYLICPSQIDPNIAATAIELAEETIKAYDLVGILAVELFLTTDNQLLINEVAPRPHNSGHHTIESCATSQYEQHLRAILNLPLGDTELLRPAVMVNLLGGKGFTGPAKYRNLEEIFAMPETHVHIYGKEITKPNRKMGHVTVTGNTMEEAMKRAKMVKEKLQVYA